MREMGGASMRNMMVCVHDKLSEELSEMYSFSDFATAGQDSFALVSFLACFRGRTQTQSSICSCPHFLCQIVESILQILPL